MLKATLIKAIRDLTDDGSTYNVEYLRGQVELAMSILGYSTPDDIDGDLLRSELMAAIRA